MLKNWWRSWKIINRIVEKFCSIKVFKLFKAINLETLWKLKHFPEIHSWMLFCLFVPLTMNFKAKKHSGKWKLIKNYKTFFPTMFRLIKFPTRRKKIMNSLLTIFLFSSNQARRKKNLSPKLSQHFLCLITSFQWNYFV